MAGAGLVAAVDEPVAMAGRLSARLPPRDASGAGLARTIQAVPEGLGTSVFFHHLLFMRRVCGMQGEPFQDFPNPL